jgi:hypothetical protein
MKVKGVEGGRAWAYSSYSQRYRRKLPSPLKGPGGWGRPYLPLPQVWRVQFLVRAVQAKITLTTDRARGAALPALAPGVELAHAGDGGRVGAATADVHNVFAAQRLNYAGPIHGVFVVMAQFPVVACAASKKII